MPLPGAPTATKPTTNSGRAQGGQSAAASPVIPFTRASKPKSRQVGQYQFQMGAAQTVIPTIQLPAAGFVRSIDVIVNIVSAGNSASVAFQPDAPFNVLQQIQLLSAAGDSLITPMDGYLLMLCNKWGAFSTQPVGSDPRNPAAGYSVTTGAVAAGGSASFMLSIPFELDARDALGALPNMAANQSFNLTLALGTLAQVYSVAPTAAPQVQVTLVMNYWALPAPSNSSSVNQAQFPPANGTVSLIQIQTPTISPSTDQQIQLTNVGNTVRFMMFVLRNSSGARIDANGWAGIHNFYINNDPYYYKPDAVWKRENARRYQLSSGTQDVYGGQDTGVRVLSDWIASGSGGDEVAQATSNRNLWLVTNSATALTYQATSWGSAAASLQVVSNVVRPSDPSALYQPFLV